MPAQAEIRSDKTRAVLTGPDLEISPAGRQRIAVAYKMIEAIEAEQLPLRKDLVRFGLRQPACRVLVRDHYGIGGLTAVIVWSKLGDCHRFSRSTQAVRHAGLDLTVDQSDIHRAGGKLSRQGPQTLRWALYEAASASSRQVAPDHEYYAKVKAVQTTAKWLPSRLPASWPDAAFTAYEASIPTWSTPCPRPTPN